MTAPRMVRIEPHVLCKRLSEALSSVTTALGGLDTALFQSSSPEKRLAFNRLVGASARLDLRHDDWLAVDRPQGDEPALTGNDHARKRN